MDSGVGDVPTVVAAESAGVVALAGSRVARPLIMLRHPHGS